ncbi:3-hexulose-6-phosphate synthase [Collibacillus ludicampi]|uniref:3-hexulose-6-phosphate synthase n=1 Tax=Collibacillus ludicampi TaxID=2771369 RepID=A0AAV4LCM5_9BACL|nr:3-hexulose-6-phosphate synthase [Collibacillus ludicampi]GIM45444.1 3-hexulose-6-phosphate synthase [Collibacillus ludicampi]
MMIQLAFDRMTIDEAIQLGQRVREYVDWMEVGTSLIKEFGMESIKALREAFPDKTIVADMKTFDNARYEFDLCYASGADVATVMGAAPTVTIDVCMEVAAQRGKRVMVDLLNTPVPHLESIYRYKEAILCAHVSKDQQEIAGERQSLEWLTQIQRIGTDGPRLALAGGITADDLFALSRVKPYVVIIGSAITNAEDPVAQARKIRETADALKGEMLCE